MSRAGVLIATIAALSIVTAGTAAARVVRAESTTFTIVAMSLDCDFPGEAECVNVSTRIEGTVDGGLLCVSVADNREVQLVASGCRALVPGDLVLGPQSVDVVPTVVGATNTADCYFSDPEEACTPATIQLDVAAAFSWEGALNGPSTTEKSRDGRCKSTTRTTTGSVPITGTLTVEGITYALPGSVPDAHTAVATLEFTRVTSTSNC